MMMMQKINIDNVICAHPPHTSMSLPITTTQKLCLLALTVQGSAIVLVIRYASQRSHHAGPPHLQSTVVFWTECVKLVVCFSYLVVETGSVFRCGRQIYEATVGKPVDCIKVWIPSTIYIGQNQLFYIGISNLDAATFSITYQLKILTTALMSVAMLNRRLSWLQWSSLVLLVIGVALVQIGSSESSSEASRMSSKINTQQQSTIIGLTAVLCLCLMSSIAGVYFEKILKSDVKVSLWLQNIRLSLFGAPIALAGAAAYDGAKIVKNGFFQGYDALTLLIILLFATGGLLVALCMKHTDNIMKGFSQSCAVVISCMASTVIFGFKPTWLFGIGTCCVLASTYIYNRYPVNSAINLHNSEQY